MIESYLSLLIAIVGLILYMVSANPKIQKLGELSYWVGLLAFLLHWSGNLLVK